VTEKQRGTADMTLVAWVDSPEAVAYLANRFGQRARALGTLEVEEPVTQPVPTGGLYVWLRYTHHCKNKGNHDHDAKRFYAKAMDGGPHRHHLFRTELNDWDAF
jgi:hypothetical protein